MPILSSPTILLLALTVAHGGESPAPPPIYISTEENGSEVRIQILGHSATPYAARYTLEVSGGTATGNRSVQSGEARLKPGQTVSLVTLRLGNAGPNWSARLHVEPVGAAPYDLEARSR